MNAPAAIATAALPAEMSQADYAKHRRVTRAAVGKMVGGGRIPASAVRVDDRGRKWIKVADADFALDKAGSLRAEFSPAAAAGDDVPLAPAAAPAPKSPAETPALTLARTETEQYNARIRQLEYEERIGKLVPIADVARAMERCAEAVLRGLVLLPSRADDLVTAYTRDGVPGVRVFLRSIEREIRTSVAENMKLLAETPEPEIDDDQVAGEGELAPAEAPIAASIEQPVEAAAS